MGRPLPIGDFKPKETEEVPVAVLVLFNPVLKNPEKSGEAKTK